MKYDPEKSVLLVIDMQHDFYGDGGFADRNAKPISQMQELSRRLTPFIDTLRNRGCLVVFTQMIADPEKSPQNYQDMLNKRSGSDWVCLVGTAGVELEGVRPEAEDTVLQKYVYDAFTGTGLDELLRSKEIENVFITGVRTEVCVQSTAQRAFSLGYNVVLVNDMVATYDDRGDTVASVFKMLQYQGYQLDSAAVLEALR